MASAPAPLTVTDSAVTDLKRLASRAAQHDGDPPFSEQSVIDARTHGSVQAVQGEHGDLRAAAIVVPQEDGVLVEAAVDPEHRGQGLGRGLLEAVAASLEPGTRVCAWAHGDHAGAGHLARAFELEPVRHLHRLLRRTDDASSPLPRVELPEDMRLRAFQPGRDEPALLELNAAAFAQHPEQGSMDLKDLRARMAEDWFDPSGLLLLHTAHEPDRLAGFHWTKVHAATDSEPARGEVYVVGVSPQEQGRGLGRALTLAGLNYLHDRGLTEVELYVDEDNTGAFRLYRQLGFAPWHLDVMHCGRLPS